jgi:hypothetical protein
MTSLWIVAKITYKWRQSLVCKFDGWYDLQIEDSKTNHNRNSEPLQIQWKGQLYNYIRYFRRGWVPGSINYIPYKFILIFWCPITSLPALEIHPSYNLFGIDWYCTSRAAYVRNITCHCRDQESSNISIKINTFVKECARVGNLLYLLQSLRPIYI